MTPEHETQLREALTKVLSVPEAITPSTREAIANYLVTGTIDKEWLEREANGFDGDLCSLVTTVMYYAYYPFPYSLTQWIGRLHDALDHYYNEP